jgi:LysM repeat protein
VSRRRRKPSPGAAHYLAPAAFLLGITVAVLLIHSGLQHNNNSGSTTAPTSVGRTTTTVAATTRRSTGKAKRFYTVQTGDTYGTIAAKQGISVAQLEALNPGVSSTALQVGQKLRVK